MLHCIANGANVTEVQKSDTGVCVCCSGDKPWLQMISSNLRHNPHSGQNQRHPINSGRTSDPFSSCQQVNDPSVYSLYLYLYSLASCEPRNESCFTRSHQLTITIIIIMMMNPIKAFHVTIFAIVAFAVSF